MRHDQRVLLAPVSTGELLDKISILLIKTERIADPAKRALAAQELELLDELAAQHVADTAQVRQWRGELREVNEALWEIEDRIRGKERVAEFDAEFIELARAVYLTNDRRAAIKRRLNEALGSGIVEVKDYG